MSRFQLAWAEKANAHRVFVPSSGEGTPATIWGGDALHWYRADLGVTIGASGVSSWADQVGSSNLTQVTSTLQPTHNTPGSQNGQDSITFDGTDDRLENASNFANLTGNIYQMMVYKLGGVSAVAFAGVVGSPDSPYMPHFGWGNTPSPEWRAGWHDSGGYSTLLSAVTNDAVFHVHEVYRSGTNALYDIDGVNKVTQSENSHTQPSNAIYVGRGFALPNVTVEVFELFFATNYSDANRDSTRTYLNDRYGISI